MKPALGAEIIGIKESTELRFGGQIPLRRLPWQGLTVFAQALALLVGLALTNLGPASASTYDFLKFTTPGNFFAVDPDQMSRSMNPRAPDHIWTLGQGWGIPPFYFHSKVPGVYDRVDFFYPLGKKEESTFQSKLKFQPFFENSWSKVPPFDGYSRVLTAFKGRSDLGQEYWGVFPFYGHMYRRFGVDRNMFFLFPLYYETTEDDARTIRLLWPIVTYANSPGRKSFRVWPLFGKDAIRNEYFNWYVLWPFVQQTIKHPGTEQKSSYLAAPFPLYVKHENLYSTATDLIWPFFNYYEHHSSGHKRYTFRPFITYGTGGGVEELSVFYVYSYKKDNRKGTDTSLSDGRLKVDSDSVYTEQSFLYMSTIKKQYRKGLLVYAKYRFWPFAEYIWDLEKGSHLKVPEIIPLKGDFWDLNLGHLLRLVDLRETPITRELSILFGFSRRNELKAAPYISRPPKPGDDNWSELVLGSFGKR